MGAFFTNMQVHIGGRAPRAVMDAVVDALRSRVPETGPWELADDGAHADRVVLVAPGQHWVTVFDEHTESQHDGALDEVGGLLSRVVDAPALCVVVHDSDVLRLRLSEKGALTAVFDSSPDDFGAVTRRPSSPRDLSAWRGVLADGATLEELAQELEAPRPFAEQRLDGVARILGLDAQLCQRGLHALMRDSLPPECVRVAFVRTDVAARPPSLAFPEAAHPQELVFVGEQVQLAVGALSTGGAGRGLQVAVWGSALDGKLLELRQVSVHMHTANDRQRVHAVLEKHAQDGKEALGAELLDARIPGAVVDGDSPAQWAGAHLGITLQGEALEAGEGELHIGLRPVGHAQGRAEWSIPLRVQRPPRRPLHAVDGADASLLNMMEVPRTLFALVTLEGDAQTCAASAATAMSAWNDALCTLHAGTYVTELIPDGRFHPRSGTLSARGLEHTRKWTDIQQQLVDCALFQAHLVVTGIPERAQHQARPGPGFAFSRSLSMLVDGGAEPAAFLGLWIDVEMLDGDARAQLQRTLAGIVDGLCAQGRVTQACMATWDWVPSLPADPTPYELACGRSGAPVGARASVEKLLRAVTETLWLGPGLARRVDAAALRDVAQWTTLGAGCRLTTLPRASLTDLERAVDVLLPRATGYGG